MNKSRLTIKKRLLIILGIFNVLMVIIVASRIYTAWSSYQQAQQLEVVSEVIDKFYNVNRNLSLARAASLALLQQGDNSQEDLFDFLQDGRQQMDEELKQALAYLQESPGNIQERLTNINLHYRALLEQRAIVDAAVKNPSTRDMKVAKKYFSVSQKLISEIQDFILMYSAHYQDISPMINQQVTLKYFVWTLAENTGMEYAIIGQLIAKNRQPSAEDRERLMSLSRQIDYDWVSLKKLALSNEFARKLNNYIEEAYTQYFFTFEQVNQLLQDADPRSPPDYLISTEMWLGLSSQVVDSLFVLQNEIMKETRASVEQTKSIAKQRIYFSISILICAILMSLYTWRIIVVRIMRPINTMVDTLYAASKDPDAEPVELHHQDEIEKLSVVLEAFRNKTQKIKQSNEELERFAFIAAHDLKSPLRAVESLSEWLEEDLGENIPEKNRQHLAEIRNRIRLMDRLLDDTLEYARVDTKIKPKTNELVIGKLLLEEIITLVNPPSSFTIKIDNRLSEIILLRFPLQQVLYNLIGNALIHHDKQAGLIEIKLDESDSHYKFFVCDDGPGIDQRYHQKIFEMFQTLQPRDKTRGRGLGLAIVRKIITNNGENISIESTPGQGSAFCFTWPKPTLSDLLKYKAP
jgi:signal transduction histidine kinase